ncbi:glycosyltransferase [Pseudomonas sp. SK3(2021)]|uniref:glycosyltransferase n=1 Tax=Pseudomonas sp. SK3(2021) TaxID=2841064 RepID=UPI00192CAE37|nr:glycosyltransferase [Pseudomonas sp. SK3(2021)]QQZ40474.1 glycosyltransferase [Pseudomonas sp. SK3(2021)]
MFKRPVIGVPFNYDESWIGGTYYIKNLISSLNEIADSERPDVWIISHSKESFDFISDSTGYPRLNWIKPANIANIDGGISRRTKLLSWLTPRFFKNQMRFDLVFPYPIDTRMQQTACWIPDFQDKRLPDFFNADELAARDAQHRQYFQNYKHLVFSSEAVKADFNEFFPEANVNQYVVRFATFEGRSVEKSKAEVLQRYRLPETFFYCPNQFWIHKNHEVVIDAVCLLKKRGVNVTVVFSGKEHDHRAPDHTSRLKSKVEMLGVADNIRFLGFIPRDDQMVIFEAATCIVQPSLFEGWSTVIEDAKSVSQYVIASAIPANIEQAQKNIDFFEPYDAEQLSKLLEKYSQAEPQREELNYKDAQVEFANSFMRLVSSVKAANSKN